MSDFIGSLLDPARVARALGIEVETLGVWRRRGFGPRWYRIGKKIKYAEADLQNWVVAQAGRESQKLIPRQRGASGEVAAPVAKEPK